MINIIRNLILLVEKKSGFPIKRFIKFSIVGFNGILVNMSIFFVLNEVAKFYYKISSLIAIEVSIITNFFLNYYWTWGDRINESFIKKFLRFHLIAFLAGFINYIVLLFLVSHLNFNKYLANLCGIGLGFLVNFSLNHFWNFKK
ncbi:MAG TPA: GtrA family protein [Spirochaetota bacterium]|nr:GtrA family protein [Spirochaetota bacterium]HOM38290.1 GtrA family protein [Spirochaetota bacterium]HPQ48492.1 GtrA family protein [Spirochaetota bacterium]